MHNFRSNVAERFFNDLMLDSMPSSPSVIVDFFPAPPLSQDRIQAYYNAYNRGVRSGRITPDELDAAVGNGPQLTTLIKRIDESLPDIKTSYDLMSEEP